MTGSRILALGSLLALCLPACGQSDDSGGGATGDDTASTAAEGSEGAEATSESGDEGGTPLEPGPDTAVWAFQGEHMYFLGEDNRRQIDAEIELPAEELGYEQILLNFQLDCPNFDCDDWDRKGYIGVVHNPGTEDESVTEVLRFITPYGVGGTWQVDVSELRPLLTGTQTLRLFVDTWVGPGHANGNGWLVNAQFEFKGGVPSPRPLAVIDLWPEMQVGVGDPANPVDGQVLPQTVDLPEGTTNVQLRSIITGHGQGNLMNCAEFCPMTHGFMVNNEPFTRIVWRDDCVNNPVSPQGGNWQPPRAGWCPGADVIPWVEDVSGALAADTTQITVEYGLEQYENTCRPGAPVCEGCALGTSCDYDGGNHTPPEYKFSAVLIAYGD